VLTEAKFSLAEFASYFESDNVDIYYGLTQDGCNKLKESYENGKESCTHDEYKQFKESLLNSLKTPATGWYRIKNYEYNTYAGYNKNGAVHSLTGDAVASVIYLDGNDGKYTIQIAGQYLQASESNAQISLGDNAVTYTFEAAEAPGVFRATGEGASTDYPYMNGAPENKNYAICGWVANSLNGSKGSYWYIEDAKYAIKNLTQIGEKYYATLYAPFPASITGATAYGISTVESGADGTMTAKDEQIGTTIAGGEPVILVGTGATATLTIAESAEKSSGNVLAGLLSAD